MKVTMHGMGGYRSGWPRPDLLLSRVRAQADRRHRRTDRGPADDHAGHYAQAEADGLRA
jgi:hypothetical protein